MTDMTTLADATISQLLTVRQAALDVSDRVIAEALGYTDAAVVTLIKAGTMRLPVNKATVFANALDLDTGVVMRALLRAVDPSLLHAVERCLAPLSLSPGEARLIHRLRSAAQGRDITPVMFEKDAIVALVLA